MKTEKKSNRWVYEYEEDKKYRRTYTNEAGEVSSMDVSGVRYVLGEIFEGGRNAKVLICIGVNPSTAIPGILDPTLRQVEEYASEHGYGAWYMLNLYPQRATDPDEMHEEADMTLHNRNVAAIRKLLEKVPQADVWCAWGATIKKRSYLSGMCDNILKLFSGNGYILMAYGQTKEGHPSHPLVMKRTDELKPVAKFEKLKPFNLK